MTLTPLELDVIRAFHAEFGFAGFPAPEEIGAAKRENTGVGRFTDLVSSAKMTCESPCTLTLSIEMEGLAFGLGALVFLEGGCPAMLELHTWDGDWDGVERPWRIQARNASNA